MKFLVETLLTFLQTELAIRMGATVRNPLGYLPCLQAAADGGRTGPLGAGELRSNSSFRLGIPDMTASLSFN